MEHHNNPLLSILMAMAGVLLGLSIGELTHTTILAVIGGTVGWLTHRVLNLIIKKIKSYKKQ